MLSVFTLNDKIGIMTLASTKPGFLMLHDSLSPSVYGLPEWDSVPFVGHTRFAALRNTLSERILAASQRGATIARYIGKSLG
jgi:hypothetical protein